MKMSGTTEATLFGGAGGDRAQEKLHKIGRNINLGRHDIFTMLSLPI